MSEMQTRRRFLTDVSFDGAAALLPVSRPLAAEGRLRPPRCACRGFRPPACRRNISRKSCCVPTASPTSTGSMRGPAPASPMWSATAPWTSPSIIVAALVTGVDSGDAVTGLAPIHVGCLELIASESVRTIADLKGKSVGVEGIGSSDHLFAVVTAAHIGLDPVKDITWVVSESPTPAELFAKGKLDAVVGSAPIPQDLRARRLGHVLASSTLDYPWSQYFCCILSGNRNFVRKYPVATKRVMRAFLKAS